MTRRWFSSRAWITALAFFLMGGSAAAGSAQDGSGRPQRSTPITNVDGRSAHSLNGAWHTIVDPYEAGYISYRAEPLGDGYFRDAKPRGPSDRVEYDFDASPTLRVPGDWNSQRRELFFYEGPLWYRKTFRYTPMPGRRSFVHFGAVNRKVRVFLNGEPVGDGTTHAP